MAASFVNVDRKTPMLLPPDLRDWVPDEDMVHFVLEAVEGLELSTLKINHRGSGSKQYPPKMMLALLIYCYANGIFSSRRIERATYRDVGVRYLTGDTHPDHDTICAFRRQNFEAVAEAFLGVLQLARQMGVLKVGMVSVDGTLIAANASKNKNVRYDRAAELDEQLRLDIAELLKRADQTDQNDKDEGQSLPKEIARREALRAKMQQARETLQERARAQAESELGAYKKRLDAWEKRNRKGKEPSPPEDTPNASDQANLTDPDSRLMRKSKRDGFVQGYNAQATVDADGSQMVLSNHVSTCSSDANELKPGVDNVAESIGKVKTVLADTGYANIDAIEELESDGVDAYVAVSREDGEASRRYDYRPKSVTEKPPKKVTDPKLKQMQDKLRSDKGKSLYAKRKQTVEPVFGIIKHVMGFRQFLLRTFDKISGEWELVCLAYNIKRLFALQTTV